MSKKHFIALADTLRSVRPDPCELDYFDQWTKDVESIANFCRTQNPRFNRERWMSYIAGECGPNGGKVAA